MTRILSLLLILPLLACRPAATGAEALESCDLGRQACEVATAWGPLRVDVSPRPVAAMRELSFELRFAGPASAVASLDLNGIGMDMGPNQARMSTTGAGVWRASMYVPVCATGGMRWRLGLSIDEGGGRPRRWFFPLSVGAAA